LGWRFNPLKSAVFGAVILGANGRYILKILQVLESDQSWVIHWQFFADKNSKIGQNFTVLWLPLPVSMGGIALKFCV